MEKIKFEEIELTEAEIKELENLQKTWLEEVLVDQLQFAFVFTKKR